jgi:hypothetical protein
MSIPEWIYLAMGALIARILLDGTTTRGLGRLDWLRLIFNIVRIVFLWPLVLFIEKVEAWLKPHPKE